MAALSTCHSHGPVPNTFLRHWSQQEHFWQFGLFLDVLVCLFTWSLVMTQSAVLIEICEKTKKLLGCSSRPEACWLHGKLRANINS